jgi:hypothetical protein
LIVFFNLLLLAVRMKRFVISSTLCCSDLSWEVGVISTLTKLSTCGLSEAPRSTPNYLRARIAARSSSSANCDFLIIF